MPWVIRDTVTNDIIAEAALQSSTFNESILATDPDYIAYLLATQKADKIKEVKGLRDERASGGVSYNTFTFQTDPASVNSIDASLAVKERGNATFFPLDWTLDDNSVQSVTDADFVSVFDLCGRLAQAAYNNYQTHRAAILAATDEAAVDAIDITTGWPVVPYTG